MVGYDFDKTIYNGDSFIDFYKYVLLRFPYLIIILPFQLIAMAFVCRSKKKVKEVFAFYLHFVPNVEKVVIKFWQKNVCKIKGSIIKGVKNEDIVISASPKFIVEVACKAVGINNCIATEMDKKTGKITGQNCYGEEKLKRFKADYSSVELEAFYSDSLSDLPMAKVSKSFYIVKGNNVEKFEISKQ